MQKDFNQSIAALSDQLKQLSERIREFSDGKATELSFDSYSTLKEIENQTELYRQCLENNDWEPAVLEVCYHGEALLSFLQKEVARKRTIAEFNR